MTQEITLTELGALAARFNKRAAREVFNDTPIADRLYTSGNDELISVDYMIKHFAALKMEKTPESRASDAYAVLCLEMADIMAAAINSVCSLHHIETLLPKPLQNPALAAPLEKHGAKNLAKLTALFG